MHDITLTIPGAVVATLTLLALTWVGMGVLCWPVVMWRYHAMMSHNRGWTWGTTILGRPARSHHVRHWVRLTTGHVMVVLAWPIALHEARPRRKRYISYTYYDHPQET